MSGNKHAVLSPSSAARWMRCTPSARLEAGYPDEGSAFAEEGTLAHAYCARALKTFLGRDTASETEEIARLAGLYHTGEMDEAVEAYRAAVLERFMDARRATPDALLLVEVRLDFSRYVPEAFGTADAVIIADDLLEIFDFKYGKGVAVDAAGNPQTRIYALGAYEEFSTEYLIRRVRANIVQPRLGGFSTEELTVAELRDWAEACLTPKARLAFEGAGEHAAGEWCRFCRHRHRCAPFAEHCVTVYEGMKEVATLTPGRLALLLPELPAIKIWLQAVEDYTLQQALQGVRYDGYKLVEGRSVRKITDTQRARAILDAEGVPRESYLKPEELRGITDLERLLGKKRFAALLAPCVEKPPGKPALVPASDRRPEYSPAAADFKDFIEH